MLNLPDSPPAVRDVVVLKRPDRRAAARNFALLRGAALVVIGYPFFAALGPEPLHFKAYFFASWVFWCFVLGALTALPRLIHPGSRIALVAAICAAAPLDALFAVDGPTFQTFHIHGGELFIRLAVAGSRHPVILRWSPAVLAGLLVGFALLNVGLAWLAGRLADRGLGVPRPGWRAVAVLGLIFAADRSFSAVAAYRGWHWPEGQTAAFPFYPQLSANKVLDKALDRPPADAHRRGKAWPAHPLTRYAAAPTATGLQRPNVLLILLESWRRDAATPAYMPKLSRWAQGFTRAERHYSGGDATRYGLFTLFYGLNPTSIERLRAEKTGPHLFSYLAAAGYRTDIVTGEPLDILGTEETVFVDVLDRIYLPPFYRSAITDRWVVRKAEQIFTHQPVGEPYFTMAFLTSTHARYDFIPELVGIERKKARNLPPRVRYDASLRYVDDLIDALLKAASARPDWDNTIVVITGDHGEEFGEHGNQRHGWSLNEEETSVPLFVRFPGQATGSVFKHLTTHVDVVPTLLDRMGDPRPAASHSDGRLLGDDAPRLIVQQDWRRMAIFDGETRIDFFHGSAGYFFPLRARDDHEAPRAAQAFIVRHRDEIEALLLRNARFFN